MQVDNVITILRYVLIGMKMKFINFKKIFTSVIFTVVLANSAKAAISLDRTRAIYVASDKSISLNIGNESKKLPFLAQGWIENENGEKSNSELVVLPPVQRIENGEKSQIKIQRLPAASSLPQDRESLFYFNLREIPPKSDKANTLQIALQTRIKLFYRPVLVDDYRKQLNAPWQEKLTMKRDGNTYVMQNPTPFYITIVDISNSEKSENISDFEPLMLSPKSELKLNYPVSMLGTSPVITYINDYGARPRLQFSCKGTSCEAKSLSNN